MRKLTAILLAVLLLFTLAACGGNEGNDSSAPVSSESSQPISAPEGDSDPQDDPASSDVSSGKTTTARSRTSTTTTTGATTTTFDGYYSTVGEKPVTYNTAILYNKQSSKFDSQAEDKRQSILNEKDTVKPSTKGKTYYISPTGDDKNVGTSKDKAWRTTKNLHNEHNFKAGDVVLFERGGVYRNVSFHMASGVTYGAYGDSSKPKPCLYGSDKNYADEKLWEKTSTANIWRLKVGKNTKDIGNFVFDHGKASGIKVLKKDAVTIDFQFYHDAAKGYVYLYLTAGNPGKVYSDIEICVTKRLMYTQGTYKAENITIENLCIKYTGAHGIVVQSGAYEAKNITVRGCEIGWIGGGLLSAGVQYGNGIEFNGPIDGALVEDNWIYQCYDAGYTNQGACYQKNITVKDNLIEYNPYNIEVWSAKEIGKGGMENCTFKDNLLRFAGYGFGTIARNTSAVGNISFYDFVVPCENTVIRGNIFDCSYRYVISIAYPNDSQGRGPTIEGNTWNQKPFANALTTASVGRTMFTGETVIHSCGTQAEMEKSVKIFDRNPKAATLEG